MHFYIASPIDFASSELRGLTLAAIGSVKQYLQSRFDGEATFWVPMTDHKSGSWDDINIRNRTELDKADTMVVMDVRRHSSIGIPTEIADSLSRIKPIIIFGNGKTYNDSVILHGAPRGLVNFVGYEDWTAFDQVLATITNFAGDVVVTSENIQPPAKDGDIGYDLVSTRRVVVEPFERKDVEHDLKISLPLGSWALITARSSTFKRGMMIPPGIIDTGYKGPIFTFVINLTNETIVIEPGERLAQMVFFPTYTPNIRLLRDCVLPESERGESGFGSTS